MSTYAQTTVPNLSFTWEDLLGLLRDELQEYGSLLGLLSAQQQSILDRRPESLLEINQTVQTQMEASQILQKRRQGFVSSLANTLGILSLVYFQLRLCVLHFQVIQIHDYLGL